MSYTFSRRAFLKYSAASAVAVAGMSMLGGCSEYQDPQNPVSTATATTIALNDLRIAGTLESADAGVFKFTVITERDVPLLVDRSCFAVWVVSGEDDTTRLYSSFDTSGVLLNGLKNPMLSKQDTATFTVTAPDFPALAPGDTVYFKYMPIGTSLYSSYSMTWKLEKELDITTGSGT